MIIDFPKSTYMYWKKRFKQKDPDAELKQLILEIRDQHKDYGYRRMKAELRNRGFVVNKKRIQRIMQELNLQVTSFPRKSRKYSPYKGTVGKVTPNRINRRLDTTIPCQKITTDTTEFKYYENDSSGNLQIKKLYLDPFMDMYNKEIVSYKITKQPNGITIMEALADAIKASEQCPFRRTFHSDQGWAYQMKAYGAELRKNNIFQSMSRKGNWLDNSSIENLFGLLKQEIYYGNIFYSYGELEQEIIKYIHHYNYDRIKEKLNWMSSVHYREHHSSPSIVALEWQQFF